jgi:hypothetical protein
MELTPRLQHHHLCHLVETEELEAWGLNQQLLKVRMVGVRSMMQGVGGSSPAPPGTHDDTKTDEAASDADDTQVEECFRSTDDSSTSNDNGATDNDHEGTNDGTQKQDSSPNSGVSETDGSDSDDNGGKQHRPLVLLLVANG